MKTRASFFKMAFMALIISTAMVSCGKNNKSGGSGSSNDPYGLPGGINGAGYGSFGNMVNTVANENPCRTNNGAANQRVKVAIPLPGVNVNAGSVYVGVTPEGDVAVVSNTNGAVMDLHLCARPDLTGQGQLMNNPVLNTSQLCPVSEITAANVALTTNSGYGNYILQFFPIHIPGTDRYSSLCR